LGQATYRVCSRSPIFTWYPSCRASQNRRAGTRRIGNEKGPQLTPQPRNTKGAEITHGLLVPELLSFQKAFPGEAGSSDVIPLLILSFVPFAAMIAFLVNTANIILPPSFLYF